ncbi:MAG: hypothetical protein HC796_06260 [Synechococcaceae cyanobacterium RL_1_2]|nr:hypothetical protein [Synechococcaceae cyanobacterium RL_1_2]
MNKKYLALGGGLCGLVLIGIGGVFFDNYRDQSIKAYFEESIEVRLGTDTECEVVDSSLFSSRTLIQNCIIKNDPNYESENLAYISNLEISSKNLTSQEQTEISSLTIEGVKLNFDIKYLPPSINLEQMLSQQPKFKNQDQKKSHNKDFLLKI